MGSAPMGSAPYRDSDSVFVSVSVEKVTISRNNSYAGYYNVSGVYQTSGTCTTTNGCTYYKLIQYYDTNHLCLTE